MICALVQAGKTVGVTANSHKVIRNLLDAVVTAADEMGVDVQCMQKPAEKRTTFTVCASQPRHLNCWVPSATAFTSAVAPRGSGLRSTPPKPSMCSLSMKRRRWRLLMCWPSLRRHPPSCCSGIRSSLTSPCRAAIQKALTSHRFITSWAVIRPSQPTAGCFLSETWRLHPDICAYTSELFYGGRLHPRPGLEVQEIRSSGRISGAGLLYVPVPSEGNQSSSPEEADCVAALIDEILGAGTTWIDRHGTEVPVTLNEILIIAPYNAQVIELQDRIPGGPHRYGRQIPRSGSADCHLFNDDLKLCGRAAGHGVSLQPQPAQRCHLASQMHLRACRLALRLRSAVSDAAADAACERILPISRASTRDLSGAQP